MADTTAAQAEQIILGRAARIVLGCLTAVGAISLDFYLMAMPAIALALSASDADTQLTVSAFVVTFGLGQIFWGPVSDRFGRRVTLFVGLALYVVGSLGSAVAWNIESLIGWRLLQGFGACCGPMIARAMVRDAYRGQEASRVLALMAVILGLTPIVAPVIGGLVSEYAGWRYQFIIMGAMALILIVAVALGVRETHQPSGKGISLALQWVRAYGAHLTNRRLLYFAALVLLCAAGVFTFVSASAFIFIGEIGATPIGYAIAFSAAAGGYVMGATLLMRSKSKDRAVMFRGLVLWVGAGVTLGVLGVFDLPSGLTGMVLLAVPLMVFMMGIGHVLPVVTSMALSAAETDVGAASGLIGMMQYVSGAIAGAAVGYVSQGSHAGMCFVMAGASLSGLLLIGLRELLRKDEAGQPSVR